MFLCALFIFQIFLIGLLTTRHANKRETETFQNNGSLRLRNKVSTRF